MDEYGVVTEPGTVRFKRLLPGPIDRVWSYLADSEKRRTWLASGDMDLRDGGRYEFRFRHADLSHEKEAPARYRTPDGEHVGRGDVIRCDPPWLLVITWGEDSGSPSEVTFALTPKGNDVLLTLTHRRLADRADMTGTSGGWHAHLAILEDVLNGRAPRGFWSTHTRVAAEYERRVPAV